MVPGSATLRAIAGGSLEQTKMEILLRPVVRNASMKRVFVVVFFSFFCQLFYFTITKIYRFTDHLDNSTTLKYLTQETYTSFFTKAVWVFVVTLVIFHKQNLYSLQIEILSSPRAH